MMISRMIRELFMRQLLLGFLILGAISGCAATRPSVPFVEEGACRPDVLTISKVSKIPTVLWTQSLFKTSFASKLLHSKWIEIKAVFGKYENFNIVNLEIIETIDDGRGGRQSGYVAAKGNAFSFGFTNGAPMKFITSDVSNVTLREPITNYLVKTVVLSIPVLDKDMATISGLTNQQIDSVRIELAGPVGVVEESVDPSNGNKMAEKFSCFQQYLDRARTASK